MNKQNLLLGYTVEIGKCAEKAFKSIDKKTRDRIFEKLKILVTEEIHSINVKKLEDFDNFYRIRLGSYRIVYEPLHKIIVVYVVFLGQRKSIYQELKRFQKNK